MSAERVAELYMQFDQDSDLRGRIAAGDASAFGEDGSVTEYEKRLLIDAAAEDWPEVSTFAFTPGDTFWAPYRYIATQYVYRNLTADVDQARFSRYINSAGPTPDG
jgi:hypothetical protein